MGSCKLNVLFVAFHIIETLNYLSESNPSSLHHFLSDPFFRKLCLIHFWHH